jgi:hypothetical protein
MTIVFDEFEVIPSPTESRNNQTPQPQEGAPAPTEITAADLQPLLHEIMQRAARVAAN